jgi:hypothetical protein
VRGSGEIQCGEYKEVVAFIVEADDRLSKEAQKLLIACDVCVVQVGALY